ncbi:MAG: hypothetical protein FWF36_08890 [Propionibacteriaceae bacterium]|nr:hypothetical protein [Propionibacteriaceae bacterium]
MLANVSPVPPNAVPSKADLRRQCLRRRKDRPAALRASDDASRQERALAVLSSTFDRCDGATVCIYLSHPPEPETTGLAKLLHDAGWHVIVPSQGLTSPSGTPAWTWYGSSALPAELAAADVIIMPGLAGTRDGNRLGRGRGWYDRALRSARAGTPRWLLLNDDEVVNELPVTPHDAKVDLIITQSDIIDCNPARRQVK